MDELDYLSYGLNDAIDLKTFREITQTDIQEMMYWGVSTEFKGRYTYFYSYKESLYICTPDAAKLVQEDFVFDELKVGKHNVLYNILNDANNTEWRLDK